MEQNLSEEDVKKIISDYKGKKEYPAVKSMGGGLYSLNGVVFGEDYLKELDKLLQNGNQSNPKA